MIQKTSLLTLGDRSILIWLTVSRTQNPTFAISPVIIENKLC